MTTNSKLFSFSLLASFIFSCFIQCKPDTSKFDELSIKYDSIQLELANSNKIVETVEDLVLTLDSIELGFEDITFDLEVGTNYTNYNEKMSKVLSYVERAEAKIYDLETSSADQLIYISSLKNELNFKIEKINELERAMEELKNENIDLYDLIAVQSRTLHNTATELEVQKQAIALIEAHIIELLEQAQVDEANSYYARGIALEEAANRTKLAPKKKKETINQALELYEKSLNLGNENAQLKIDFLRSKLKK